MSEDIKLQLQKRMMEVTLSNPRMGFRRMLSSLQVEVSGITPLAAVSNTTLYLNPVNIPKLSDEQFLEVLEHEVIHTALRHPKLCQSLFGEHPSPNDARLFNIAADMEVNSNIHSSFMGEHRVLPENFGFPPRMGTLWYIRALKEKQEEDEQQKRSKAKALGGPGESDKKNLNNDPAPSKPADDEESDEAEPQGATDNVPSEPQDDSDNQDDQTPGTPEPSEFEEKLEQYNADDFGEVLPEDTSSQNPIPETTLDKVTKEYGLNKNCDNDILQKEAINQEIIYQLVKLIKKTRFAKWSRKKQSRSDRTLFGRTFAYKEKCRYCVYIDISGSMYYYAKYIQSFHDKLKKVDFDDFMLFNTELYPYSPDKFGGGTDVKCVIEHAKEHGFIPIVWTDGEFRQRQFPPDTIFVATEDAIMDSFKGHKVLKLKQTDSGLMATRRKD